MVLCRFGEADGEEEALATVCSSRAGATSSVEFIDGSLFDSSVLCPSND